MVPKGDTKTVQPVDSRRTGQSTGMKRSMGDSGFEPPNKRWKATTLANKDNMPVQPKEMDKPWAVDPNQVFRFMDLPGELRNRIYGVAVSWSYRCFPMTHEKPKKSRRGKADPEDAAPITQTRPLPYIGLTQVCSIVRTEFRPLWLSTHRFPLFALGGYFKAFFPVLRGSLRLNEETRKRIKSSYDAAGTLRLWIRRDCMRGVDLLPLLKFRHRFPAYTITLVPAHQDVTMLAINSTTALINNTNATWVKYIRQHQMTQVRLEVDQHPVLPRDFMTRIVIKERYAPGWMGSSLKRKPGDVDGYKKHLGLDNLGWNVVFAVDYS